MADTAHGKLLNNVLAAIYEKYGRDACVQKINVINAKAIGRGGTTRHVRSAQDGTADIVGCICGVPVAIEIKHGKDTQSQAQKDWQQAWHKAGGVYMLGISVKQVTDNLAVFVPRYQNVVTKSDAGSLYGDLGVND